MVKIRDSSGLWHQFFFQLSCFLGYVRGACVPEEDFFRAIIEIPAIFLFIVNLILPVQPVRTSQLSNIAALYDENAD